MELKPCPFCGSEVEIVKDKDWLGMEEFRIECPNQECQWLVITAEGLSEGVKAWNRRAKESEGE